MKNIDDINYPVNLGEEYLVPCIEKTYTTICMTEVDYAYAEQLDWMDIDDKINPIIKDVCYDIPIINHCHSDKENGQKENHYHVDFRFMGLEYPEFFSIRYKNNEKIIYKEKIVLSEYEKFPTHPDLIKNSKIKHKKAKNYKCPHRGYDLRKVKPKNGCITCPLHGLKFKENNMELIDE